MISECMISECDVNHTAHASALAPWSDLVLVHFLRVCSTTGQESSWLWLDFSGDVDYRFVSGWRSMALASTDPLSVCDGSKGEVPPDLRDHWLQVSRPVGYKSVWLLFVDPREGWMKMGLLLVTDTTDCWLEMSGTVSGAVDNWRRPNSAPVAWVGPKWAISFRAVLPGHDSLLRGLKKG